MPPKIKKKEIADDISVDETESSSDDSSSDESEYNSDNYEDEEEEENVGSESDQCEENEELEDEEEGEEEDDEENEETLKEKNSEPKITIGDLIENETKKSKIVSMDYCSKYLYQGPIENIKDMLNGSVSGEIEIKEEPPTKNIPAFKNVSKKWGWKQEVMLLEGIEMNGLFNWEMIAAQLTKECGKKFKAEEVKNHYYQYYFEGTLGQVWNYELVKPVKHFDHTDPIVVSSTNKYLPPIDPESLREIKFLPHREDFEVFPFNDVEMMVTRVDFSSYYMNNLKALKIDQEVRNIQLFVVDAYLKVLADRINMYKFMKDFKLIEQYFKMQQNITKKCELDKYFFSLQKFLCYFNSPHEFIKFYFDCVKEKLLKLEIARLYQVLATKKKKERDPEMKITLKKRAPACFSVLTRILYCTNRRRGRRNLNLPGGKEHDRRVLVDAHATVAEGMKIRYAKKEIRKL